MNIYTIDEQIRMLVNEDGEISDLDAFEALQMERERKLENVACWIKNLRAEAVAIKAEEVALKDRRSAVENRQASLEQYLERILDGETFKSPKAAVTYRTSRAVVFPMGEEAFIEYAERNYHEDLLQYSAPKPSKSAIKDALERGFTCEQAVIETRSNMQIK